MIPAPPTPRRRRSFRSSASSRRGPKPHERKRRHDTWPLRKRPYPEPAGAMPNRHRRTSDRKERVGPMAYEGTNEAWIVGAARTPIGRHGGALSSVRPDDLGAVALGAVAGRAGVAPSEVEDVFFGCANG